MGGLEVVLLSTFYGGLVLFVFLIYEGGGEFDLAYLKKSNITDDVTEVSLRLRKDYSSANLPLDI